MKSIFQTALASTASFIVTIGLFGSTGYAQATRKMYQANLTSLNGSGASGTTMVELLSGNTVKVTVNITGTSPGLPHAQHIHIGGNNTCPAPSADKDNDNLINTVEGQPSYGEIKVSLTTSGDVSKDSGLAVDRFPAADAKGSISYSRTFELPAGVTEGELANGVIVHHGISELFNDKTKYDGDKKSPLKEDLPLEATIPSACGKLISSAKGGIATGGGSTAGTENTAYAGLGAAALISGAMLLKRRNTLANLR